MAKFLQKMYNQLFKKKVLQSLSSQVKHGNGRDATSHSDTEVVSVSNFTRKKNFQKVISSATNIIQEISIQRR